MMCSMESVNKECMRMKTYHTLPREVIVSSHLIQNNETSFTYTNGKVYAIKLILGYLNLLYVTQEIHISQVSAKK